MGPVTDRLQRDVDTLGGVVHWERADRESLAKVRSEIERMASDGRIADNPIASLRKAIVTGLTENPPVVVP
jgi:hypothetical protein